jgi:hypothetical protein
MRIGRGRQREHMKDTHLTSMGSPTGEVWWRHFRSKGPTRADIAQLPIAHAQTLQGKPTFGHGLFRWRHFRSEPLPVTWPPLTSLPVAPPWQHSPKYDMKRPDIVLMAFNISLVIGNWASLIFGLERFIPFNNFLTIKLCVVSSNLFNFWKKLMPDK